MMTDPHLIEQPLPQKQASIDSVHEKHVRHGHVSTLHIWSARWPLAAARAAHRRGCSGCGDPFGSLLARAKGGVVIDDKQVLVVAAEPE